MSEAIADLFASAKTFQASPNAVGVSHSIYAHLAGLQSRTEGIVYPSGTTAVNAAYTLAHLTGNVNGGTFTLTFYDRFGNAYTTAGIAYNAAAAAILSAINTAATGHVANWTNGDIAVTGSGNISNATQTLTFSGASVAGAPITAPTINAASVTVSSGGAAAAGAIASTASGQPNRPAWAILVELGIIAGSVPAYGADASGATAGAVQAPWPFNLNDATVKALCVEAGLGDGSSTVGATLLALLGF